MEVKQESAKKIGLISSISILIGSMIGVGIFFKNKNVFEINNDNSIAILIAWIISGLISLCAAFSFAEIGSAKQSHSGIGGWYEELIGPKSGRFVKIIQPFFYYGLYSFSIAMFCGEAIFNMWGGAGDVNFGLIMFIGLIVFILLLSLNYWSLNASSKFQVVATALKFIPLGIVVLGGIIYGSLHGQYSFFNTISTNNGPSKMSFVAILTSIPSILFAFDSFVCVGNFSMDVKNPEKTVPLTVVIGMIIVTTFYLLVTIAQMMVGQGDVYEMIKVIGSSNQALLTSLHIITSIFIFISILGVVNAMSLVLIRSSDSIVEENLVVFANNINSLKNKLLDPNKELGAGFLLSIIFLLFWFILLVIPSSIMNSDAIVDIASNFPTTFFFSIYATIILAGLINRKTKKVAVIKIKGFIPMGIIAVIGCYFVSAFNIFYAFLIDPLMHPHQLNQWGLFCQNGLTPDWVITTAMLIYVALSSIYYGCCVYYERYANKKKIEDNTKTK